MLNDNRPPVPPLSPVRLEQMIQTALAQPQERRAPRLFWPVLTWRLPAAGLAFVAIILLITTVTGPTNLPGTDTIVTASDDYYADFTDLLLYETL